MMEVSPSYRLLVLLSFDVVGRSQPPMKNHPIPHLQKSSRACVHRQCASYAWGRKNTPKWLPKSNVQQKYTSKNNTGCCAHFSAIPVFDATSQFSGEKHLDWHMKSVFFKQLHLPKLSSCKIATWSPVFRSHNFQQLFIISNLGHFNSFKSFTKTSRYLPLPPSHGVPTRLQHQQHPVEHQPVVGIFARHWAFKDQVRHESIPGNDPGLRGVRVGPLSLDNPPYKAQWYDFQVTKALLTP